MKIKQLIYCSLILIISNQSFAQQRVSEFERLKELTKKSAQIDSASVFTNGHLAIKEAKKNKSLTEEAEIVKIYGDFYYYLSQFDKAKVYYSKAKKLVKNEGYTSVNTAVELREFVIQIESGEVKGGKNNFIELIERAKFHKDTVNIIDGLNNLGNRFDKESRTELALQNYLEALKYAKKSNNLFRIAYLYNNIGLLKFESLQYDEALEDFINGVEIAKKIEDERLAGHLFNNIGLVYSAKEDYEKANDYYFKFLSYAKRNNSVKEMGVSFLNIGHALLKQKQYENALAYYDSTAYLFEGNNVYYFLPKTYMGRALILIEIEDFESALMYVDKGMEIATEYNMLEELSLGHKLYSDIAKGENEFELALTEYKEYKELTDSIDKLNNKKKFAELEVQYDVEKKENDLIKEKNRTELLEKEKELEKIKLRTYIIFSIIGIIVFIILFFIRHFSVLKRKQEEFSQNLIENIDNERARIAKDLHDDLGQRLSVIKNKIHLNGQQGLNENSQLENEVGGIIEQTRDISHQLYPAYLAKIGLDRSIAQLLKTVQEDTALVCSYSGLSNIDSLLSLEEKTHFYRILQECVNNTLKHSEAKALKVSIQSIKNGLRFTYRDNGKGLKEKKGGKGIGFMSMLERVKILNGTMEISANSGKGIKLIFEIHPKK